MILIDDAQLLERESLMDLCSLIVCPPKKAAVASLIIVGDDMLAKQMQLAVMTPIRTRLTVNFRIDPLSDTEAEQFIAFRLRCAQAPKDLLEPDAITLIAAHCHGNRRQIMNPNVDGLLKSLNSRHPGDGRDPELSDITGFRPSPE
jgi:type II secretory pathway predicted ATPase ExeA